MSGQFCTFAMFFRGGNVPLHLIWPETAPRLPSGNDFDNDDACNHDDAHSHYQDDIQLTKLAISSDDAGNVHANDNDYDEVTAQEEDSQCEGASYCPSHIAGFR